MRTFKVLMYNREVELYVVRHEYSYPHNTMIQLNILGGEPYCALTTNPGFEIPENGCYICVNNYGPIVTEMVEIGILKLGDRIWRSGFNTYHYFEINEDIIRLYERESL